LEGGLELTGGQCRGGGPGPLDFFLRSRARQSPSCASRALRPCCAAIWTQESLC